MPDATLMPAPTMKTILRALAIRPDSCFVASLPPDSPGRALRAPRADHAARRHLASAAIGRAEANSAYGANSISEKLSM